VKIEQGIVKRVIPQIQKRLPKIVIGDLKLEEWEQLKSKWEAYIINIEKIRTYEYNLEGNKMSGVIEKLKFNPSNFPPLKNDTWFVKKYMHSENVYLGIVESFHVSRTPFSGLLWINIEFCTWVLDIDLYEWTLI